MSERKFSAAFNQQFQYVAIATPSGVVEACNEAVFKGTDLKSEAVVGLPFWDAPWWRGQPIGDLWRDGIAEAVRTVAPVKGEGSFLALDGGTRTVTYVITPIANDGGAIANVLIEGSDITARKRAEQRQELLINELNHRVKNSLANILAIASQTFRSTQSTDAGLKVFQSRLMALSRAHDLLTQEKWESAGLRDVVMRVVSLVQPAPDARFHIDGPNLRLTPTRALAFALAFHELATNALKYGALANEAGTVAVRWVLVTRRGGQQLALSWSERDGPPVAPPCQRGFGSRMIERGLAAELGGPVVLDFRPAGLVCSFEVPFADPASVDRGSPEPTAHAAR